MNSARDPGMRILKLLRTIRYWKSFAILALVGFNIFGLSESLNVGAGSVFGSFAWCFVEPPPRTATTDRFLNRNVALGVLLGFTLGYWIAYKLNASPYFWGMSTITGAAAGSVVTSRR
jgi:hypothetical protein